MEKFEIPIMKKIQNNNINFLVYFQLNIQL